MLLSEIFPGYLLANAPIGGVDQTGRDGRAHDWFARVAPLPDPCCGAGGGQVHPTGHRPLDTRDKGRFQEIASHVDSKEREAYPLCICKQQVTNASQLRSRRGTMHDWLDWGNDE